LSRSTRSLPSYWGRWFSPVGDGCVKRTNLNIFYNLGKSFAELDQVQIGTKRSDMVMHMIGSKSWLHQFLVEMDDVFLPETKGSAKRIYDFINRTFADCSNDWDKQFSQQEMQELVLAKQSFETNFDEEHKRLAVFTVLPKGIYDMDALMNTPEQKFPEKIRAVLPGQMFHDLKQAALCLSFEIPTACAFHVCRGTEAVMLAYYELLVKHPWAFKKRDWKIYIEQLAKENAPKRITDRLDEIRELDRNTYIHPDVNVSLEEAPILFELCTGVVFLMGQEMDKLTT
jgi:hypothetical protein